MQKLNDSDKDILVIGIIFFIIIIARILTYSVKIISKLMQTDVIKEDSIV